MDKEQAEKLIRQALAMLKVTLQEHQTLQQAVDILIVKDQDDK